MDLNQVSKNSSINIETLKNNTNISQKEQEIVVSIFNKIDNTQNDEDKSKGIINGKAVTEFLSALKTELGNQYNDFMQKTGLANSKQDNSQAANYTSIKTGTIYGHKVELLKDSNEVYYAKLGNNKYIPLRNTNTDEAFNEAMELLSDRINADEIRQKEKEAKAPKPYTYRGIKVSVREIKFNMKGEVMPEGMYNYGAVINGCACYTRSKEELEKWIDKHIKQCEEAGYPINADNQ